MMVVGPKELTDHKANKKEKEANMSMVMAMIETRIKRECTHHTLTKPLGAGEQPSSKSPNATEDTMEAIQLIEPKCITI